MDIFIYIGRNDMKNTINSKINLEMFDYCLSMNKILRTSSVNHSVHKLFYTQYTYDVEYCLGLWFFTWNVMRELC